jgi:hypothetical protein
MIRIVSLFSKETLKLMSAYRWITATNHSHYHGKFKVFPAIALKQQYELAGITNFAKRIDHSRFHPETGCTQNPINPVNPVKLSN